MAFLARPESSIGRLRSVSLFGGRVGPGCRPGGRPSPGNVLVGEVALSIWKSKELQEPRKNIFIILPRLRLGIH